ncbi:hypothetical protein GE09DRAFT_118187 [Coniochaeta sp. 2T2.1]|nr:hypothetical protein GE09DRAFT_118187 [Coniochaeta sp. 2T2.1]
MSSLPRGLCAHVLSFSSRQIFIQPLPVRIACRGHLPISRHLFSTLPSLSSSSKPSKPTKATASPLPKSKTATPLPSAAAKPIPSTATRAPPPSPAYAALLSSKSSPTLLYEAPNQFWFTFSAFNAGAFCLSYTAIQYYTIFITTPAGLAWWVPHGYAAICVFMSTIGFYWMRWPSRIVRSIHAVPGPSPSKSTPRSLELELAKKRWIPFLPLKKTRYLLEEVHVPAPVANLVYAASGKAHLRLSPREELEQKRAEEEKKARDRQYELDHIMTAPFRHFGRGAKLAWQGMARALTREGFAKIRVKKSELKLDVKGGWFLDEGKALDRLIHARPDEK